MHTLLTHISTHSHTRAYLFLRRRRGLAPRGGRGRARNRLASSRLGLDACALHCLAHLLRLQSLLLQLLLLL